MLALFCLALRPAIVKKHTRLPEGASVAAYIDDNLCCVCDPGYAYDIFCLTPDELRRGCQIDVNLRKFGGME